MRTPASPKADRIAPANAVVVIGLGQFGMATAKTLVELGRPVLAIDSDLSIVESSSRVLTHTVQADAVRKEALEQVGVDEFTHAVVAIGDVERSVLCTAALVDLEIDNIWAKAASPEHAKILTRIGAHQVIQPEVTMGQRVAHMVASKSLDYIEFDDGFAIVKCQAPGYLANRTLAESQIRSKFQISVIGTKRPGRDFVHATQETVVLPGDQLIISGPTKACERFTETIA